MNSRVHPKYKTKYRVNNWATYDRALVERGDITIWLSPGAIADWEPARSGKRGGQWKYSKVAIEAALTLRLVFSLPLRQAEDFLNSLFGMMGIDLSAPDHTTLSRRGQRLEVQLHHIPANEPVHLIVDSTGLSIVGEGEWAAAKHGGKGQRGWKKLHLGVDGTPAIIGQILTDGNADNAKTGLALIQAVERDIASVTADAAYDTIAIYEAANERGAKVVVPPTRTATVSRRGRRSASRDRTIRRVKKVGRRQWKKESGYHRQGTALNAFFRYKSMIGDQLRARAQRARETEAVIACNILNRMAALGRPSSYAIGA